MLAVWYERQGADRGVAGRRDAGSRARPCRTQTWRGPAILAKFALHCLTGRPHLVRVGSSDCQRDSDGVPRSRQVSNV